MDKNKKKAGNKTNVFVLDELRAKKKSPLSQILKETKKVAAAIAARTCLICNTKKACVSKTGVCSYCFEHELTSEEKTIAEKEAKHKIIKIQVTDNRWEQ